VWLALQLNLAPLVQSAYNSRLKQIAMGWLESHISLSIKGEIFLFNTKFRSSQVFLSPYTPGVRSFLPWRLAENQVISISCGVDLKLVGFKATTLCRRYRYTNVQESYLQNMCAHTIKGIGPVSLKFWFYIHFFSVTLQPSYRSWPPLTELHNHTRRTHHILQDFSGRVISPTQGPLPDNTQHSQEANIHAPDEIQIHNSSKWVAADPRLRPHGHWDWLLILYVWIKSYVKSEVVMEWNWP
jgi:hypothetical protein